MIGRGFKNLLTRDVLTPPQRQQLEDWMRANEKSSMRAGLPPGWTTADKTGSGDYGSTNDVGIAYGPAGRRVLLAMMTRSQANDPKAQNLRPLIGELTTLVIPALLGVGALRGKHPIPRSASLQYVFARQAACGNTAGGVEESGSGRCWGWKRWRFATMGGNRRNDGSSMSALRSR
jgi:hypothetical protein